MTREVPAEMSRREERMRPMRMGARPAATRLSNLLLLVSSVVLTLVARHGVDSHPFDSLLGLPAREDGLFAPPCKAVPQGKKFYMYDFDALRHCSPTHNATRRSQLHDKMLKDKKFDLERLGPTLFFEQQLAEHPWRTMDPEEADLFVLPTVMDLAAELLCQSTPEDSDEDPEERLAERLVEVGKLLADSVRKSPYYSRKGGADHLLFFAHLKVRDNLFSTKLNTEATEDQMYIRDTFRNFIIAEALSRNYRLYSSGTGAMRPMELPPSSSCMLTVPFFAPSATKSCSSQGGAPDGGNKLVCKGAVMAKSIEEYLEHRDYSYTFIGMPRNIVTPNMRDVVIRDFGPVKPPSILVYTTSRWLRKISNIPLPRCKYSPDGIPQPSPCEEKDRVRGAGMHEFLKRSKFSIHVKGADSGSSRVFDALHAGALQISIADRYMEDSAAFKCRVPWDRMFFPVGEREMWRNGTEALSTALEALEADDNARMREMLELQQAAVPELLWHVPGSRAGQNVIEDALRCASAPAIPGEMPKHITDMARKSKVSGSSTRLARVADTHRLVGAVRRRRRIRMRSTSQ